MAEERTPRTKTTREVESRPSDSWIPASILPDPDPRDDGFTDGYEPVP